MVTLGRAVLAVVIGGVACGGATELTCGEGTVARDGECVVDESTAPPGGGSGSSLRCGAGTVERNGECVVAEPPDTAGSGGNPGNPGAAGEGTAGTTTTLGGSPSNVDLPPGATAQEVAMAREYCDKPEEVIVPMADGETVKQLLVGRWLLCGGSVLFGRNDTAGIRFESDGTWSFMMDGGDGSLVDALGFDNTGGWNVLETGQTNIDRAGGGGDGTFPAFSTVPPKMRFSSMIGMSTYASLDR